MPYMQVNGVNLYYEQAGHGESTLVLIHGNVASSRWWDRVWSKLSEQYTVVRMDLRGCGQSDKPGDGYTVSQYSEDVKGLVTALGLKNIVVVGHSMGGSIAMNLATSEPKLVKKMILINSAPAAGIVTPDERKPLIEQMIQDRNLMKMAIAAVVPTAAHGEFFEQLVDDAMVAGPTIISNYTSLGEADYRKKLAFIDTPTLIIFGTQDSLISLNMMEQTHDVIPSSTLILYEGTGHSPNVEAPDQLIGDIERFVTKMLPPGR